MTFSVNIQQLDPDRKYVETDLSTFHGFEPFGTKQQNLNAKHEVTKEDVHGKHALFGSDFFSHKV